MKTQSADTSPEAERVQIALLRQASPEKRLRLALGLSAWTLRLSLAGLRRWASELGIADLLEQALVDAGLADE